MSRSELPPTHWSGPHHSGARLRFIRNQLGISLKDQATAVSPYKYSTVIAVERGLVKPSRNFIEKYIAALNSNTGENIHIESDVFEVNKI